MKTKYYSFLKAVFDDGPSDPTEAKNIADKNPEIIEKAAETFERE